MKEVKSLIDREAHEALLVVQPNVVTSHQLAELQCDPTQPTNFLKKRGFKRNSSPAKETRTYKKSQVNVDCYDCGEAGNQGGD